MALKVKTYLADCAAAKIPCVVVSGTFYKFFSYYTHFVHYRKIHCTSVVQIFPQASK